MFLDRLHAGRHCDNGRDCLNWRAPLIKFWRVDECKHKWAVMNFITSPTGMYVYTGLQTALMIRKKLTAQVLAVFKLGQKEMKIEYWN